MYVNVIKGKMTRVVNTTSFFAQLMMDWTKVVMSLYIEWLSPSWLRLGG
jgi:hypothetical protein